MPDPCTYDYAIVRVVPRVERGEFVNVGAIVSSDAEGYLEARFEVDVKAADGSDDAKKSAILAEAEAALCAGRAGVRILSAAQVAAAKHVLVVADVNTVPPPGVEGLEMTANGTELTPHGTHDRRGQSRPLRLPRRLPARP